MPCIALSSASVCLCNVSWCLTKGKGNTHTPRTLAGQRFPECLSSPEPVLCVCVVNLGTLERRGGGVNVALRRLIILLLLGSVLGEGGGQGKLDFVFVNKL